VFGLVFSAVDVPEGFLLEWWSLNNDFEYFRQMHVSYPPPSYWFINAIM